MLLTAYFDHLYPFFLISSRISGLILFMPVFGNTAIPGRVKIALVVTLSLIVHFGFAVGFNQAAMDLPLLLLGMLKEFIIGTAMGLMVLTVFSGVSLAGALLAPQIGFAMSTLIDPTSESMQPMLATLMNFMAITFFLAIDGHLMVIQALFESYRLLPLSAADLPARISPSLIQAGATMLIVALKISAPVLAVILFLNVGMAVMARAVPQVNIIVIGFILSIGLGLAILTMSLPSSASLLRNTMIEAIENSLGMLKN